LIECQFSTTEIGVFSVTFARAPQVAGRRE
jgi:hypothetical protein